MRLVSLREFRLVGLHFEASWNELAYELPKAWKRLLLRSAEIPTRVGDRFVHVTLWEKNGLCGGFVGSTVERAAAESGAEPPRRSPIPRGLATLDVPGGQFIYGRSLPTARDILDGFGSIYEWAKAERVHTDEYRFDAGSAPVAASGHEPRESDHNLYVRVTSGRELKCPPRLVAA